MSISSPRAPNRPAGDIVQQTSLAGSPEPASSLVDRLQVAAGLLLGLRKPDFQAAGHYMRTRYPDLPPVLRCWRFTLWALHQMFVVIPNGARQLTVARAVSRTPFWLEDPNPLANHPWAHDPAAMLPEAADTIVIGAGFTGAALAYFWSKRAPADRPMVVLEMDDPACGASGRNEGLVVMGRYFKMVRDTVKAHLPRVRPDLSAADAEQLSRQFASVYCRAAYRNAELIEKAIREEGFDCDYVRAGWVQGRDASEQQALDESVRLAEESGYADWMKISPEEAYARSGMRLEHPSGWSRGAASWHPAKWVWCLLQAALRRPGVTLFTRTKVQRVEDCGDGYIVQTTRGPVRARHVVYATESYTPAIDRRLHGAILPMQEQAASGEGGPASMKPHVGISAAWFFAGRYVRSVLFGSGGSVLPDEQAERNRPSRFLTRFVAAEMRRYFGPYALHMTNEWSGTVGYTPDEYPIVGSIDGRGKHIIAGMCGSGSGVSFNAARCICNRILGIADEPDDYPAEYFGPGRLLEPRQHKWPVIGADRGGT